MTFFSSLFVNIIGVCVVIAPPLARLLAVANEETCCPSQPQENSNGKLCAILVGGRFFRSPVGRVPINPLLHPTTDRNLGTVTNKDVSHRSSWRFESTLYQNPITDQNDGGSCPSVAAKEEQLELIGHDES